MLTYEIDAKAAADRLAREVHKVGLETLMFVSRRYITVARVTNADFSDHDVLSTLHAFAANKKSGYERESAAVGLQALATTLGAPSGPLLLPSLAVLYELYMDKGDVVRAAASAATKSILKLFPPESTRIVYRQLEDILEKGKWRTKVGALDAIKSFVGPAREQVAAELGDLLPKVERAMHDTKQEVRLRKEEGGKRTHFCVGLLGRCQMRDIALHNSCEP